MPSFERILDKLRYDMAETPEEKEFVRGYIKGKSRARKEVLYICIFLACIATILVVSPMIF